MAMRSSSTIRSGLLLIADITGYTVFLKDSELEHANGILSDLLAVMVAETRAPFTISRLEGDAVFSYAIETGTLSGETSVEIIESSYVAFRRAIEQMVMNTRCQCNACANIGNLDLKFIIHHGDFMIQEIGDHRELVGSDVNMAHRLTKNSVAVATGIRAYALYTEAAVDRLGLAHMKDRWSPHHESYDVGDVNCWVADMEAIWQVARSRSAFGIPEAEILDRRSTHIDLPVERVWDRLTHPDYRRMLIGSDRQELRGKRNDSRGVGDVYLCWHGDTIVTSEVLEWIPFEYLLTKDLIHVPGSTVYLLVIYWLAAADSGSVLTMGCARPTGPRIGRMIFPSVLPELMAGAEAALGQFRDRIESETAQIPVVESDR